MPAILCEKLERSVAKLLSLFTPPWPRPEPGVHPSAVVAPTARLGADTAVGPHVVIGEGAIIGDRTVFHAGVHVGAECKLGHSCVLWDHVVVRERCTLGDRVILHPHVVIGGDGFGYYFADGVHQKIAHGGIVRIEDDVEIGAGTTVDRAKFGATMIGRGTKIDNLVQIGHNVVVGENCLIVAGVLIGGSAVLKDRVTLGGNAGIKEHNTLEEGVRVAAHSCVWGDVAAGSFVSGIPARDNRQYLRGLALAARLPELHEQVRELTERLKNLEAATDHPQSG